MRPVGPLRSGLSQPPRIMTACVDSLPAEPSPAGLPGGGPHAARSQRAGPLASAPVFACESELCFGGPCDLAETFLVLGRFHCFVVSFANTIAKFFITVDVADLVHKDVTDSIGESSHRFVAEQVA